MKKADAPLMSLFKRATRAFRLRYILYLLLIILLVIGGRHYWKERNLSKESSPKALTTSTEQPTSTPTQQNESQNGKETEEEEDENEEDDTTSENTSPWTLLKTALPARYSETSSKQKTKEIVIILTGLGLDKAWTEHILTTVDKNITLVFSPYASNINEQIQRAMSLGFHPLVSIPMEPYHYPNPDPGPYTLLTGVKEEDNIQKINKLFEKIPPGIGAIGEYGSKFATSKSDLEPIFKAIKNMDRLFVDHNPTIHSQIQVICKQIDLPCFQVDQTLPIFPLIHNKDEIIKIIVQNTKENGMIVISVPAIPAYINLLPEWIDTLGKNDIKLITIAGLSKQHVAQEQSGDNQGTTNANQQDAHQPR